MTTLKKVERYQYYSSDYKEKCFQTWFLAGRPSAGSDIMRILPDDEFGRKPSKKAMLLWKSEMQWDFRADELDAKALSVSDDDLVARKVAMLRRQAEDAEKIAKKAIDAMLIQGFDSSAAAVNAYFRATEEQRNTQGMGETLKKLAQMSNADLKNEIIKQLQRASESGQIVDADALPVEEDKKEEEQSDTESTE